MKKPRIFPSLGLFAVLLASACAPALTSPTSTPVTATPTESAAPATLTPTSLPIQPEATLVPTEIPPQPIATSRGPDLEATDPMTVSLASGGLQLVEFFRFT